MLKSANFLKSPGVSWRQKLLATRRNGVARIRNVRSKSSSAIIRRPQSGLALIANGQFGRQLSSFSDVKQQQAKTKKEVVGSGTERTLPKYMPMDGNMAAAHVAYALSDITFIYPISPATSMGEYVDEWATQGRTNIFGQPVSVNMMQSEGGAAGALHGAGAAGALSSTFTASQGLLLMIPNMYLLAGELVPTVFHVSARTVSRHALSIFNDHSDVMACRQTGFCILASGGVQEVMDLGTVAHLAAVKTRLPFLHFFDGYRTSAEIQKIEPVDYSDMKTIFPFAAMKEHLHKYALNPQHPTIRGTGQRPDIFFQNAVAGHRYYQAAPGLVEETMRDLASVTGRNYNLFDYHGSPNAERIVVLMGSASKTMEQTVDYLNEQGENVGVLTVRLYRPWSGEHFYKTLPQTAKKIAVLDRTREDGASGMPLFLDVNVTLAERGDIRMVTGATYGLASKEFTPAMAKAVFDNLNAKDPKMRYVIGIEDDVTNTSLPYGAPLSVLPKSISQCLIYGLGGDGMVGASKNMIKLISNNTELSTQGHFVFDSKKTDGLTVSHLRFGPEKIRPAYSISSDAHFVECSHPSYPAKYDMLSPLEQGGIFVLNSPWNTVEQVEEKLPTHFKKQLANKEAQFYNLDAAKIAAVVGLGRRRINSPMTAAFYHLSGVLPQEQAMKLLKDNIARTYKHKGPDVVEMNQRAVDETVNNLVRIDYHKEKWSALTLTKDEEKKLPDFVKKIMNPVLSMEGDKLPVSAFEPGGYQPTGTTMYEKRGLAPEIPVWVADKCTQCNYCAIVCPHAVVRPFLLDRQESKSVPEGFEYRKAKGGAEVGGYNYTIQISPMDCTGCAVCVQSCPDDALYMAPFDEVAEKFEPHWDYAVNTREKGSIGDKYTVKGSQFEKPLMEFSCACSGCGETPYVKLATQLFGEHMVVANASGCSSVWGGTSTTIPFTKNSRGMGPAWGRSLFEDNAEYGLGMMLGTKQRRQQLAVDTEKALGGVPNLSEAMRTAFEKWLAAFEKRNKEQVDIWADKIVAELNALPQPLEDPLLRTLWDARDMFKHQSHWMIGGDGWAYDIGLGGVDHVLSLNEDVNILVLDTEMYSNTGGEMSKATPMSAVVKYATSGKQKNKKDLGMHAMLYDNVYVASVAMGASYAQTVQAFKEAESYPGPSLILAFSPCIDWGIDMKYMMDSQKQAVDTGYWTLYRYDPRKIAEGLNPFQLDSKKIRADMAEFLKGQNRFERLHRDFKTKAITLQGGLMSSSLHRHEKMKRMAMDDQEQLEYLMKKLGVETMEGLDQARSLVLYGSETGNAQGLSGVLQQELKKRQINAKAVAMDDFDFEDIGKYTNVFCVVSTAGQGEFPANCQLFWKTISDSSLANDTLQNVKFAVFGLGDSGYVYFNEAAKLIDKRLGELGGQRLIGIGLGDDKDDERYETQWAEWSPDLWSEMGTPPPPQELLPPTYDVRIDSSGAIKIRFPSSGYTSGVCCATFKRSNPCHLWVEPRGRRRTRRGKPFIIFDPSSRRHSGIGLAQPSDEPIVAPGALLAPLVKNISLTPPDYPRSIRHYEFDIEQAGYQYAVGDCLGIHPHNNMEEVDKFLHNYELDPNSTVLLEDTLSRKDAYPPVANLRQLFTEVLDIFGRPTRRFYETLSIAAKDEGERSELEHLLTKEGSEKYKEMVKETVTYADLLSQFPSSKMSLGYLLDHIPRIKPRLYSIASSQEMHGNILQLCIVKDDWTTPSGRYRQGLCTRFIETKALNGQELLATRLNAAGINIPDSQRPPYVMVALGTGIAPMRAMVEDREMAKNRGETVGEMALFFGARYKATEYSYGDEFEDYHANGKGVLPVLSTAFSRDQEYKIYVQNRISEVPEVIYDYLVKKNGFFYLCGPAGNVPPAVRKGSSINY